MVKGGERAPLLLPGNLTSNTCPRVTMLTYHTVPMEGQRCRLRTGLQYTFPSFLLHYIGGGVMQSRELAGNNVTDKREAQLIRFMAGSTGIFDTYKTEIMQCYPW